jgi:hypothetical protein
MEQISEIYGMKWPFSGIWFIFAAREPTGSPTKVNH